MSRRFSIALCALLLMSSILATRTAFACPEGFDKLLLAYKNAEYFDPSANVKLRRAKDVSDFVLRDIRSPIYVESLRCLDERIALAKGEEAKALEKLALRIQTDFTIKHLKPELQRHADLKSSFSSKGAIIGFSAFLLSGVWQKIPAWKFFMLASSLARYLSYVRYALPLTGYLAGREFSALFSKDPSFPPAPVDLMRLDIPQGQAEFLEGEVLAKEIERSLSLSIALPLAYFTTKAFFQSRPVARISAKMKLPAGLPGAAKATRSVRFFRPGFIGAASMLTSFYQDQANAGVKSYRTSVAEIKELAESLESFEKARATYSLAKIKDAGLLVTLKARKRFHKQEGYRMEIIKSYQSEVEGLDADSPEAFEASQKLRKSLNELFNPADEQIFYALFRRLTEGQEDDVNDFLLRRYSKNIPTHDGLYLLYARARLMQHNGLDKEDQLHALAIEYNDTHQIWNLFEE